MIARLHYITQDIPGLTHARLAELACEGGADWVQLRVKNRPFAEHLRIAEETLAVCRKYGATLIINDQVEIARQIRADGVHLGKEDMDPAGARKKLGDNFIIGGSTNTFEDVKRMQACGVDYIGNGPFRFTSTKENLNPVLGIEGVRAIADQCRLAGIALPVIAIGGIRQEDIGALLEAGVHGVAVSSAINHAASRPGAAGAFIRELNRYTIHS